MSPLERFLLLGILFLAFIRLFILPDGGERTDGGPMSESADPAAVGAATGGGGPYEWNPRAFTRLGIPAKLNLTADGRVPDAMRLNDTQKAFVYAAMIETYQNLLARAHKDCAIDMRRDIVRWQARHARTIADATEVLKVLTPGRDTARAPHDAMAPSEFAKQVCPTAARYLATGAYDPHPEAVARLAHAARGARPTVPRS